MDNVPQALLRRCLLALCVWREARGESGRGKALVATVILNRVMDRRWPDTIEGVITQPKQFSAFNGGDPNAMLFPAGTDPSWAACVAAADNALQLVATPITPANHYHVVGLSPAWADASRITDTEGHHVFYHL